VEWVIFVVGLAVTGALAASIALSLTHRTKHHTSRTAAVSAPQPAPATPTTAPAPASPAKPAAPVTTAPAPVATITTPAQQRPASTSLQLTATRGDSWLEVRSGSATGRVLFAQTLPSGETQTFRGSRFWVRFGAASNIDARLGGKTLRLPVGTYSTVVTRAGLGPLAP